MSASLRMFGFSDAGRQAMFAAVKQEQECRALAKEFAGDPNYARLRAAWDAGYVVVPERGETKLDPNFSKPLRVMRVRDLCILDFLTHRDRRENNVPEELDRRKDFVQESKGSARMFLIYGCIGGDALLADNALTTYLSSPEKVLYNKNAAAQMCLDDAAQTIALAQKPAIKAALKSGEAGGGSASVRFDVGQARASIARCTEIKTAEFASADSVASFVGGAVLTTVFAACTAAALYKLKDAIKNRREAYKSGLRALAMDGNACAVGYDSLPNPERFL